MLEDILTEIAERGWLVSNLFQFDDGTWQANLRTETKVTEFARGLSPADALAACIDLMETAEDLPPPRPILSTIESRASIADIIAKLAPAAPIRRI